MSHPVAVTYDIGSISVDRSRFQAIRLQILYHARTRANIRQKKSADLHAQSKASKHSYSEAGWRIDAYILGMASGRRFSCRDLEIASGLPSVRVKANDFIHTYFRKVSSEVLMQLSLQQTL